MLAIPARQRWRPEVPESEVILGYTFEASLGYMRPDFTVFKLRFPTLYDYSSHLWELGVQDAWEQGMFDSMCGDIFACHN